MNQICFYHVYVAGYFIVVVAVYNPFSLFLTLVLPLPFIGLHLLRFLLAILFWPSGMALML